MRAKNTRYAHPRARSCVGARKGRVSMEGATLHDPAPSDPVPMCSALPAHHTIQCEARKPSWKGLRVAACADGDEQVSVGALTERLPVVFLAYTGRVHHAGDGLGPPALPDGGLRFGHAQDATPKPLCPSPDATPRAERRRDAVPPLAKGNALRPASHQGWSKAREGDPLPHASTIGRLAVRGPAQAAGWCDSEVTP